MGYVSSNGSYIPPVLSILSYPEKLSLIGIRIPIRIPIKTNVSYSFCRRSNDGLVDKMVV
jgi:hypothetical protein